MQTSIALNRFGLGARAGESRELRDSRGWLEAQLTPQPLPVAQRGLPSTADAVADVPKFALRARLAGTASARKPAMSADDANLGRSPMQDAQSTEEPKSVEKRFVDRFGPALLRELEARFAAAAQTDTPFHERLVWFWTNHFTVSTTKALIVPLVGAYEREAIRPHVTGRFEDLLLAVIKHPAMLGYLDNVQSIGPDSRAGRRRDKGLNENLAREVLELHTLGVDGGYTQADVTEFARALTGWTVRYLALGDRPDRFDFEAPRHEPGVRTVLGKRYPEGGVEQAESILRDLARHPSTARHLATRLARHFAADDPPPALVDRLARAYRDSDGDLRATTRALIDAPEVEVVERRKLRRPDEYVVAAMRALGLRTMDARALMFSLSTMGQRPFHAPSPQGWDDLGASWLAPDALLKRVEWAEAVAAKMSARIDARALGRDLFGDTLSIDTARELDRAESPHQALVLLLASPDFQRR